jgi:hypothetical protein
MAVASTSSCSQPRTGTWLCRPDKFRIKIADIDGSSPNYGKVVYDNQRGQSTDLNTAEPQAISGGSIVVHKTK